MTTESVARLVAGNAAVLAVAGRFAERRRARRRDIDRDIDKVGWVPWPSVQLLAIIVAVLATA